MDLGSVRYHSSQPWPFPASLMIGFLSEAASSTPGEGQAAGGTTSPRLNDASPAGSVQPKPLAPQPRGLELLRGPAMVAAREVGLKPAEAERYLLPQLPAVQVGAGCPVSGVLRVAAAATWSIPRLGCCVLCQRGRGRCLRGQA